MSKTRGKEKYVIWEVTDLLFSTQTTYYTKFFTFLFGFLISQIESMCFCFILKSEMHVERLVSESEMIPYAFHHIFYY